MLVTLTRKKFEESLRDSGDPSIADLQFVGQQGELSKAQFPQDLTHPDYRLLQEPYELDDDD